MVVANLVASSAALTVGCLLFTTTATAQTYPRIDTAVTTAAPPPTPLAGSRFDASTPRRAWWVCGPALIGFLLLSVGCGRPVVDVPRDLRVADMTTGWFDAGSDDLAQNKLVPTISFRLDNISEHETGSLRVQGMFHRAGEDEGWGAAFIRATGREGLAPGASAGPFALRSERGYTGEQAGREMLEHRDFVDVTVELFVKHRSAQWVRLNEYQIERHLITN